MKLLALLSAFVATVLLTLQDVVAAPADSSMEGYSKKGVAFGSSYCAKEKDTRRREAFAFPFVLSTVRSVKGVICGTIFFDASETKNVKVKHGVGNKDKEEKGTTLVEKSGLKEMETLE
ncbi:hypothetical protein RMCBS344292_12818 [Rhizopus microsporus]|nr:hypothetical protein RMCBS344292_12818 [Rhizopus microsporus]